MVEFWKEKRHSLISIIQLIFYAFRSNLHFMDSLVNVDVHAQPNLPVITGEVMVNTIAQDELPTKETNKFLYMFQMPGVKKKYTSYV